MKCGAERECTSCALLVVFGFLRGEKHLTFFGRARYIRERERENYHRRRESCARGKTSRWDEGERGWKIGRRKCVWDTLWNVEHSLWFFCLCVLVRIKNIFLVSIGICRKSVFGFVEENFLYFLLEKQNVNIKFKKKLNMFTQIVTNCWIFENVRCHDMSLGHEHEIAQAGVIDIKFFLSHITMWSNSRDTSEKCFDYQEITISFNHSTAHNLLLVYFYTRDYVAPSRNQHATDNWFRSFNFSYLSSDWTRRRRRSSEEIINTISSRLLLFFGWNMSGAEELWCYEQKARPEIGQKFIYISGFQQVRLKSKKKKHISMQIIHERFEVHPICECVLYHQQAARKKTNKFQFQPRERVKGNSQTQKNIEFLIHYRNLSQHGAHMSSIFLRFPHSSSSVIRWREELATSTQYIIKHNRKKLK